MGWAAVPFDLSLTPAGTGWNGTDLSLHIFAHFLHIVELEPGCRAVQVMQRMQQTKTDKTTIIG